MSWRFIVISLAAIGLSSMIGCIALCDLLARVQETVVCSFTLPCLISSCISDSRLSITLDDPRRALNRVHLIDVGRLMEFDKSGWVDKADISSTSIMMGGHSLAIVDTFENRLRSNTQVKRLIMRDRHALSRTYREAITQSIPNDQIAKVRSRSYRFLILSDFSQASYYYTWVD